MIRKLENQDVGRVADIWLDTNLKTHFFITDAYWKSNYDYVKKMLLQTEVYVYEDENVIQGFVGVSDEYIEEIFISDKAQSHGIGKKLLDYLKNRKSELSLNVYQKNVRAIKFYQREKFEVIREDFDEATGEKDYVMIWKKENE